MGAQRAYGAREDQELMDFQTTTEDLPEDTDQDQNKNICDSIN